MNLTTAVLAPYVGGQMEIQNPREGYVYRGEIETIEVADNAIKAKFAWLGKGKGFPPIGWVKEDNLHYLASLEIYGTSNIGPSGHEVGGGDRLCLSSPIVGETVVIFPRDGSKLDRSKVEGLEPAA